ncbi:MAG: hypothetical protein AVDCRST_MAG03-2643, partial [uncultured Rubrobacteraceae bacterium]
DRPNPWPRSSRHQPPQPVRHLHRALRPRRHLQGRSPRRHPLPRARTSCGRRRGRVRLPDAPPQAGGGLLDLGPRRTPRPRRGPSRRVRSTTRRPGPLGCPAGPLPTDALDGNRQRGRSGRHPVLEGQRPLRRRRSRRRRGTPPARPFGPRLSARVTARGLVAYHADRAYPLADARGNGGGGPFRGPLLVV